MTSRTNRHRAVSLLLLALLLFAALPVHFAGAVLTATRTVASNNSDFVTGKFGLTGLVESGGVQLIPLGTLTKMRTGQPPLCQPLAEMGTASYQTTIEVQPGVNRKSTYMYVVGGQTNGSLPTNLIKTTCYTHIKNDAGITENWTTDDSQLPEGLFNLEALAVETSDGNAFLYAMGGQTTIGASTQLISRDKIYRANINENTGAIGSWSEIGQLPPNPDDFGTLGRHSFSLSTYTNDDGKTFVYIFGGARRYSTTEPPTSPFFTGYYRDVWRTTVKSDGTLGETDINAVNGWVRLDDIPIRTPSVASCAGLYDSQAAIMDITKNIGDNATVVTPTLYLMGGRYDDDGSAPCGQSTVTSADVYRATLSSDGSLHWDSSAADANTEDRFTLLRPLYGHKAFGFNQKLYVLGGYDFNGVGGPSKRVFGAYSDDNQDLVPIPPSDANFLESADLYDPAMYAHGGQVAYWKGFPMLFIFGGRSSAAGTSTDYLDRVLYAIPGEDDKGSEGFPSQGSYLSPPYDFEVTTTPISVTWSAINADTDTDIKISYRVAASPIALRNANWRTLDGRPSSSRYTGVGSPVTETVTIDNGPSGRYLQYRAILSSLNVDKTPILTSFKVSYLIDGFPNLTVDDDPLKLPSFDPDNIGAGPSVRIVNEPRTGGTSNFVIDADIQDEGTFFVDLFAFPPDVDPPSFDYNYARGLSDPDLLRSKAFVEINKGNLTADGFYDIGGWMRACSDDGQTPSSSCDYMSAQDWEIVFNQTGTWTVILVIDSSNNVHEADTIDAPWEAGNFYQFTVSVNAEPGKRIFMPIITRSGG